LKAKLSKSHHDNLQVDQEMSNCSIKLHSKNVELQHWQEKERNLDGELESIVPTNHPFYMPLLQILQHRSKRAGFQQSETGKSNASNESDDDNDDDLDEDLAEECCPLGCDATYYEQTLDLRERRLENERVAAELQHSLEDLHRNLDRLHKRKKLLETDSIAFTKELQSFQTEKQKRLNEQIPSARCLLRLFDRKHSQDTNSLFLKRKSDILSGNERHRQDEQLE